MTVGYDELEAFLLFCILCHRFLSDGEGESSILGHTEVPLYGVTIFKENSCDALKICQKLLDQNMSWSLKFSNGFFGDDCIQKHFSVGKVHTF